MRQKPDYNRKHDEHGDRKWKPGNFRFPADIINWRPGFGYQGKKGNPVPAIDFSL